MSRRDVRALLAAHDAPAPIELMEKPVIKTGFYQLDRALGGGIRMGTMAQFYGDQGSGKSTMAYIVAVQALAQYPDKYVGWVDTERSVDVAYASRLGFDMKDPGVAVYGHSQYEKAFESVLAMLETGEFSIIVLDSLGNLESKERTTSKSFVDTDVKDRVGSFARASQRFAKAVALQQIEQKDPDKQTLLLILNQVREVISSMPTQAFAKPVKEPGGKAYKHNLSLSLQINIPKPEYDGTHDAAEEIGLGMSARIKRHRHGPKIKGLIRWDIRFDAPLVYAEAERLFGEGQEVELLVKAGNWYTFTDLDGVEHRIQGREKLLSRLRDEPEFAATLSRSIQGVHDGLYE